MSGVLVRGADEQTHVHPDPSSETNTRGIQDGWKPGAKVDTAPRLLASNHVESAGPGGGRKEICDILNSSSLPSLKEKFASIFPCSTHNEQKIYTIYKDISLL